MAQADLAISGTIAASGTGTLTVRTLGGQRWTVGQISIEAPLAGASSACAIYKNGNPISPLVPQFDAAAGDPPIVIGPGDRITIVWTNATAGAAIKALIIYDDGLG